MTKCSLKRKNRLCSCSRERGLSSLLMHSESSAQPPHLYLAPTKNEAFFAAAKEAMKNEKADYLVSCSPRSLSTVRDRCKCH